MQWFLDPITNHFADFEGRAGRKEFWMFILWYVIVYIAVGIVGALIGLSEIAFLVSLVVIIPGLALTARRFHDVGMSGWWQLVGLIPVIGFFFMLYFMVKDSEPANKYGPNPKGMMDDAPMPAADAAPMATPTTPVAAESATEEASAMPAGESTEEQPKM